MRFTTRGMTGGAGRIAFVTGVPILALTLCAHPPSAVAAARTRAPAIVGATADAPAGTPASGGPWHLGLDDYLRLVREKNNRLLYQRLEWKVAKEGVANARAILESEFVGSAQHEENEVKNTVQESLQRDNLSTFQEYNEHYDGGVEMPLETGGKLRAGYHLDDFNNNLQPLQNTANKHLFDEFRTVVSASFTQPLLRNRGSRVTRSRIHVAKKDLDIAFQTYRRETMRIVADAIIAYDDLIAARERLGVRREATQLARQLVASNRERVRLGQMAQTEAEEAQAGLALHQSQELAAQQDVVVAMARVRNFMAVSPGGERESSIEPAGSLGQAEDKEDYAASVQQALRLAPEYLAATIKAEREGIKLYYARNQRWPELDMRASLGLNGLDRNPSGSLHDAFSSDNRSWAVMMEMHVPLGGDVKAASEIRAAQHHKHQALLEVKSAEVELENSVDAAIKNVRSTALQVQQYREITRRVRRLLDAEMKKLESGVSNSRLVLQRQEELTRARDDELKSLSAYDKALLELHLTRGSLLVRYGMEIDDA